MVGLIVLHCVSLFGGASGRCGIDLAGGFRDRRSQAAFSDDVIVCLYRPPDISNICCRSLRLRHNEDYCI